MIFCNPNAAYYEYLFYDGDWIDHYLNLGIHFFMWNYRGYAFSDGNPTPHNICKDGEFIYDYLKNVLKYEKIGVHGESLGGMVAVHIASARQVDFLCADRTFSSLPDVAEHGFSKKLKILF